MLVELEAELLLRHPRPIESHDLPDTVAGDEAGLVGRDTAGRPQAGAADRPLHVRGSGGAVSKLTTAIKKYRPRLEGL